MRLYRLTLATIFQRKAWAICLFAVLVLPFVLPAISSASEKPLLIQPARIQAAWGILWTCALLWGLFSAARMGEDNAKSGIGEYFQTTGISPTRQLFEIWLALLTFIAPLALAATLVCQFAASPAHPVERAQWWILNSQYLVLFLLVIGPLLLLGTSIASRFGGITGFAVTLLLALYGLYGVGYLDNMLQLEENPFLNGLWLFSPHYRFADLTQRLLFKSGPLPANAFWTMTLYFSGIFLIYAGISRLIFQTRTSS